MVSYRYYDDLRKDSPENFVPIFNNTPYVGRNLHRYNDSSSAGPELLCHAPLFIRYTRNGREFSAAGYGSSAGTMMAIHHWNNGNGVVVKEIQDIQKKCPIRFTTEIFDTEANAVPAVKGLTDMMIRDPNNPTTPQPCAIVGTHYSNVSTKFAIISGVYDLLQVAPGASSDKLDDKTQYPLFTRTHPADSGSAMLLPKYFKDVMKVENFAIVYVDGDEFGISYLKALQEYASNNEMNTIAVPVGDPTLPSTSTEDIMEDLNIILENELNYVIGIFFFDSYKPIMKAAAEMGVAGPGKFWFLAGSLSDTLYEFSQEFDRGSALAKATYGSAIITDGGAAPGTEQYEEFLKEWKNLGDNQEVLDYINSKQPLPSQNVMNFNRTKDFFHRMPNHIAVYSYEAIIGIGLAACQALEKTDFINGEIFTGTEHHAAFQDVNFLSASGRVVMGPDTYSRNETSTYFVVANILEAGEHEDPKKINLQGKDYIYFDPFVKDWKSFDDEMKFIYSDGTFIGPPEIPGIEENMNLISNSVRCICLVLCSLSMGTSLGFLIYTVKKWNSPVIRLAQPIFLVLICVGTLFMAVAIIPLSMDEGVAGPASLDASCSLTQWFFSFGFIITFAALFSKLWRTNQVVSAANAFRRVTITVADVLKPFAALSLCNVLILSIWQWGGDSPKWQRTVRDTDEFDRIVSSTGQCTNHKKSGTYYFSALIVVNGFALALACYQAYIGRNVQTGLNESKFIGMTMICICECCFFALPLLFISGSNRSGMLFVITSISFVICVATLLFIFVPKVLRDRKSTNRASLTTVENVQCSSPTLGKSVISGLSARGLQIRALQRSSGASKCSSFRSQQSSGPSKFSSFRSSLGTGRRASLKASRGGNFKPIETQMTADKFEDYPAGYFESDENEEQKVDFPFGPTDQEKRKASEDEEGGSTNSSDLDGFPEVENRVALGTVLSLIAEKSSEMDG